MVLVDRLEDHLNKLDADGYEIFGLYPVMLPVGGDVELTTFLVVAKRSSHYIEKELAQLDVEAREQ